ncbi:Membrane-spanning 4-domains subfamily A member 13 [Heterocephalus glaber]|uniref:Membrane-spanning 4-domains subfamily A member 13 n=1 Tax=Heterocephalus glaber TaxID=10181 RepID=G5AYD8_HETGA|nr:Membrane-spanning 4-domains subfamily A member 13 [Heterocephalus glaber]
MLGIFNVLMWYFLLVLYMGQIKGVFGKYEPLTYRTGCTLWGVFIVSSLGLDILCIITGLIAIVLTVVELSKFKTVSYKNYGQAKLGREVSRVLLIVYHLEVSIALTHAIFMCGSLFIFSGALTVFAQRRPTMYTMSYAIVVNIISSCIAGLGLLLLTVELSVAIFLTETSMWQMRSAKMLSEYVFLFTALELFVTCVAIQWAYKAKKSNLNT